MRFSVIDVYSFAFLTWRWLLLWLFLAFFLNLMDVKMSLIQSQRTVGSASDESTSMANKSRLLCRQHVISCLSYCLSPLSAEHLANVVDQFILREFIATWVTLDLTRCDFDLADLVVERAHAHNEFPSNLDNISFDQIDKSAKNKMCHKIGLKIH